MKSAFQKTDVFLIYPTVSDHTMKLIVSLIVAVIYTQWIVEGYVATVDSNNPWISVTYEAMKALRDELPNLKVTTNDGSKPYSTFINTLETSIRKYETFLLKSRLEEKDKKKKVRALVIVFSEDEDFVTDKIEANGITSSTLEDMYNSQMLALKKAFLKHVEENYGDPDNYWGGYVLPLDTACSSLPARNYPKLSIKDVCPKLDECAQSPHSSSTNACGKDNKCDVVKALPLMLGVLIYKVYFLVVDKFCSMRCPGGCNVEEEYADILKQVNLMRAFISMIGDRPFKKFYDDAVTQRAYSDVIAAMRIVSQHDEEFSVAPYACQEIQARPACQIANFYPQYLLLKKIKEERLRGGDTRDLRPYENIDNTKIIELKKNAIKHFELLSAIDQLDENLRAEVKGISNYFNGIATFDQGIADADVAFINGKLEEFNTSFARLSDKLKSDMTEIVAATVTILGVEVAEMTVKLVAKIASESNPIKAIFAGVDPEGLLEAIADLAKAAANLARGISLAAHLGGLGNDTTSIARDLQDNQNQIGSRIELVNKIKNNNTDTIGDDAYTFVQEYNSYTPKVDRSRLAENIAMWGAFQDSTCDLLNGVEGTAASIGKGVAGGFLLCEKLQGTIAEFSALRENIFDFQFDLVDSLARVIRGNVAKKLSKSIQKEEVDFLKADQLLGGFFMTQNFLQSQAWLYCDKLEYRNEGKPVKACSAPNGVFTNNELDNIVAYTDHDTYTSIERTVYIPSKPQFDGDMSFISISSFAQNKTTTFRLPLNTTWLQKHEWSLKGESTAPYVENFQLFLPKKENKQKKQKTSVRIVVSADTDAGSYSSTESNVIYKLPEKQISYVTVYQEGYRRATCPDEIPNPYSLCNNLPKICHTSTNVPGNSLLPTTLSRWRVDYSMQSGTDEVKWEAPTSKTNLYFIAKVKLRMVPSVFDSKRSNIPVQDEKCCDGNTYRFSLFSNSCKNCPTNSTSHLGGYYCEVN